MLENVEQHTFTAKLECRYLLRVPDLLEANTVVVLALHGYGSNPKAMLELTAGLVGERHIVAALQGPNQQYMTPGQPGAHSAVGYNWGVSEHWESSVRLHHEMVIECLGTLRGRFDIPESRSVLVGFSQAVGLNYRFAATYPDHAGGVIGICGGIPRDWEEDKYRQVRAAILHIARQEDEIYPPELSTTFADRLRKRAGDVEFHLLPGGHRFPSKARHIVDPWMARVFGAV